MGLNKYTAQRFSLSNIFIGLWFVITLMAQGCSSTDMSDSSTGPNKDLVESFNIGGEDFAKFKEVETVEVTETEIAVKGMGDLFGEQKAQKVSDTSAQQAKQAAKKTPVSERKNKIKVRESKKVSSEQSPKKATQPTPAKDAEFVYPEGFPDAFRQYDQQSRKFWGLYRPRVHIGEKMVFDVKYFGVTAGRVAMQTLPVKQIGPKKTFHFYAKLQSAPFYKYIYSLEDHIESFVSVDNFLPVKYSLVQRESGQSVDDLQLFDDEKLKTFFWYKRVKKDEVKEEHKEEFIPRFMQDSFSTLFFVRGLPLNIGDNYKFPIITRSKVWLIDLDVVRKEKITIQDKEYMAYRIKAETSFPGILKKRGDILFWFSADEDRRILRFEAKVKLGSIEGELIEYQGSK